MLNRAASRQIAGLALAAALAIVTVVVPSSSASANDGTCDPGDLCLYEHDLMSGGWWDDGGYVADYSSGDRFWGTTLTINDNVSSARSRYSFWTAFLHEHSWYRGSSASIAPGGQISVLRDWGMNDKASSNNY